MKRVLLFTLVFVFIRLTDTLAATIPGAVVETDWLKANLSSVTILDVRSDLKSFTSKPVFKTDKKSGKQKFYRVGGHIKGAHLLNYKKARVTRKISGRDVTRMAPLKSDFEKLLQDAGINKKDLIVIVSKGMSTGDMTAATRIFWQLKYYGHDDVAILNGGMAQWIVDGNEITTAALSPTKGNWVASGERKELLATSLQVKEASSNGKTSIIDARSMDQYFGIWYKSYVYAPGHIAGARAFPVHLMMRAKMPVKFLPAEDLKSLLVSMRINPKSASISYCNSGHLAAGTWFVMSEILGNKTASVYDGSMHQWTLEKRPTITLKGN